MKTTLTSATLAIMLLTGCQASDDESAAAAPAVGLPNPAATFCVEQGGSHDLETGECRLEDGTVVDAWDYYRRHHAE